MENCAFCRIAKAVSPASVVYSDQIVLAFMDHMPVNPGHVLVIPKAHATGLSDLDEETGAQLFRVAMRIAESIKRSGLKCEGVNLFLADGKAAFQEVFHVHLHVIPRFKGDGFGIKFGHQYGLKPEKEELGEIAVKIKSAMA